MGFRLPEQNWVVKKVEQDMGVHQMHMVGFLINGLNLGVNMVEQPTGVHQMNEVGFVMTGLNLGVNMVEQDTKVPIGNLQLQKWTRMRRIPWIVKKVYSMRIRMMRLLTK